MWEKISTEQLQEAAIGSIISISDQQPVHLSKMNEYFILEKKGGETISFKKALLDRDTIRYRAEDHPFTELSSKELYLFTGSM